MRTGDDYGQQEDRRRDRDVAFLGQPFAHFLGDHDGAVLSAGAAKGDGEIALALVDVVRQEEEQQVGDASKEFLRLVEFADVGNDFWMESGEVAELGNEVRVGEEAHVEDEIGFERDAVPPTYAPRSASRPAADSGTKQSSASPFCLAATRSLRSRALSSARMKRSAPKTSRREAAIAREPRFRQLS